MKNLILLFFIVFTAITVTNAQSATQWDMDKAHTSVNFGINHFFSEVTGKFKDFDGTFNFDEKNLGGSKFTFTIKVNSVDTDNSKRDGHLQTADFFDAAQFPEIKFESSKITKKSKSEYNAEGKMTMRGITKKVIIPFKVIGEMNNPMRAGEKVMGISLTTSLNRADYGIGTGDFASDAVIGNEVRINIPIELHRKA